MDRDIANIVSGVTLFLGSVGLYLFTVSAEYKMGSSAAYDAGLMPKLWLAVAALSTLSFAVKGVIGCLKRPGGAQALADIAINRVFLCFGLAALFLICFAWLGYWIPVVVFIPLFSLVFGLRNIVVIMISTAAFSSVTWLVFAWLLEIQINAWPPFLTMGN